MTRPDARPEPLVRRWGPAGLAALAGFGATAALFLLPYLANHLRYPLGWDSPFYVWRTAAVGFDGLARIGAIRPATPILFATLARLTGTDAFTVAALAPPLLAAAAGLAAAGLLRAAFRIGVAWVPVVALLAWMGFGHAGMVREQPDNVLNAALVLAAFAAAVAYLETGVGWIAAAALLAAAGLAHWPFFGMAVAVLVLAVAALAGRRLIDPPPGDLEAARARRLLSGAGIATTGIALTFLWRPPAAWSAPRLGTLREILRDRFLRRAGDLNRYAAVPLAAGGLAVAASPGRAGVDGSGRRLFVRLMVVWLALVAAAAIAQAAGVPTAGLRLLNDLFPLTLLAALAVWWLAGRAGRWAGVAVAVAALAGFGALAIPFQTHGTPWYEPDAVAQIASAGAWFERSAPAEPMIFTVAAGDPLRRARWRDTVLASLPADLAAHATVHTGSAGAIVGAERGDAVLVAIDRYDTGGYDAVLAAGGRVIAPGVAALGGPLDPPVEPVDGPSARTGLGTILAVTVAGTLLLGLAGLGWSASLLPDDPVLVLTLAPAAGAAAIALAGLVWGVLRLPTRGGVILVPAAIVAAAGWATRIAKRPRPKRRP